MRDERPGCSVNGAVNGVAIYRRLQCLTLQTASTGISNNISQSTVSGLSQQCVRVCRFGAATAAPPPPLDRKCCWRRHSQAARSCSFQLSLRALLVEYCRRTQSSNVPPRQCPDAARTSGATVKRGRRAATAMFLLQLRRAECFAGGVLWHSVGSRHTLEVGCIARLLDALLRAQFCLKAAASAKGRLSLSATPLAPPNTKPLPRRAKIWCLGRRAKQNENEEGREEREERRKGRQGRRKGGGGGLKARVARDSELVKLANSAVEEQK